VLRKSNISVFITILYYIRLNIMTLLLRLTLWLVDVTWRSKCC